MSLRRGSLDLTEAEHPRILILAPFFFTGGFVAFGSALLPRLLSGFCAALFLG